MQQMSELFTNHIAASVLHELNHEAHHRVPYFAFKIFQCAKVYFIFQIHS